MEWIEKNGINYKEAQRIMKIAKELPKLDNVVQFGSSVLYLIATLPEPDTHGNNLLNHDWTTKKRQQH